jgi:hypothetical protein
VATGDCLDHDPRADHAGTSNYCDFHCVSLLGPQMGWVTVKMVTLRY